MSILMVRDYLKDRILVSRESARVLQSVLSETFDGIESSSDAGGTPAVVVDFEGVEGLAPSFLDELLLIFESVITGSRVMDGLIIKNPPTRLSSKFQAVARGHGMTVSSLPDGGWHLTHCDD